MLLCQENRPARHTTPCSTRWMTTLCYVLVTSDGICYRIHSFILRCTSGFFRAMLTLPQVSDRPDSVTLDETSKVVGILLRMISGLEVPMWESYDDIEAVLEAAHKY